MEICMKVHTNCYVVCVHIIFLLHTYVHLSSDFHWRTVSLTQDIDFEEISDAWLAQIHSNVNFIYVKVKNLWFFVVEKLEL